MRQHRRKIREHLAGLVGAGVLGTILWYFGTAGLFVFGSGLAVVPFLHGGVVQGFHWLTERQFLDAVAVSMITPGPVMITVAFIGYLATGVAGGRGCDRRRGVRARALPPVSSGSRFVAWRCRVLHDLRPIFSSLVHSLHPR